MMRVALVFVLLGAGVARADGGTIRIQQDAGSFRITVFSAPEPLRVGAADFSVLVQRIDDEAPVVDAEIAIRLVGPPPALPIDVRATRANATNKLLHAALVMLPTAGTWTLRVTLRHAAEVVELDGEIDVAPPLPRWVALWPYLAFPFAVVTLFALRVWLAYRRVRVSR